MRLFCWLSVVWAPVRRRPLRATVGVVACLLIGLGVYYYAERRLRASRHLRQGEQAIQERDFARAQGHLKDYLAIQPDSGEGHFLLAQAYRRARTEDFAQAQTHLSRAKRLRWSEKATSTEFSLLAFQESGVPDSREIWLRQLLDDKNADRSLILEALVRGCIRADRLEEAVVDADQWIASFPDDWYAYLCRGTLHQHLDDSSRAVTDYDRVLQEKPDSADVKHRLGLALVQSGSDYQRALRYLEGHNKTHPDDPDVLVAIARCHRALQRPEEARRLLDSVLAADPNHADALLALALVDLDLDRPADALPVLRRLEPLSGSPPLEMTYQQLLRLEPVATNSSIPTRLQAVNHLLATVLRRLGQEEEAQAREKKLQQLEQAVAGLRKALAANAKNPNDVGVWRELADNYLRLGMKENAEPSLLRLLQHDPQDRWAHRALADLYQSRPGPESQRKADHHRRLAGGGGE